MYNLSFLQSAPDRAVQELNMKSTNTGTLDAVVLWFDIHLSDKVILTTGPKSMLASRPPAADGVNVFHSAHWGQAIIFFPDSKPITKGQTVKLRVGHTDHRILVELIQ